MVLRPGRYLTWVVAAVLLAIPAVALAGGGWHILSGAPAEGGASLTCFHGTDCWTPAHGWMWASTDGGRAWHRQPVPPGILVRGLSCTSASDCWATFDRRGSAGVIATTNGGRTWHTQLLSKGASDLEGISCTSDGGCVAAGSGQQMGGFYMPLAFASTKDRGGHWSLKRVMVSGGGSQIVFSFMYAVSCANAEDCWAAGQRSNCPRGRCIGNLDTVEATTDGGATWHLQRTPHTGDLFWDISCPNSRDCWAAGRTGETGTRRGVVVATTDGGVHWYQQRTPSQSLAFNGISCTSAKNCTAAGWSGSSGLVARTTDGGAHWHLVAEPGGTFALGRISCSPRGYCLATGSSSDGQRPVLAAN